MGRIRISGIENFATISAVSKEREQELLERVGKGETEAREEIINGRLTWVASVVVRRFGERDDLDDLFQLGCIGLMNAIDRYNFQYGTAFTTYATALIIGEIKNYLYTNDVVRIPNTLKRLGYKVSQTIEYLTSLMQRTPTIDEISQYTKLSQEVVIDVLNTFQKPLSLYDVLSEDREVCIYEIVESQKDNGRDWINGIIWNEAIASLSDKERIVIQKCRMEEKTQQETAQMLGISQSMVSRYERRALKKLRTYLV